MLPICSIELCTMVLLSHKKLHTLTLQFIPFVISDTVECTVHTAAHIV